MGDFVNFKITMPNSVNIAVLYEAAPGKIVKGVHHEIVKEIGKVTKTVLKSNIAAQFPLYAPGDTNPDGSPKRWQTPTGALRDSIGFKVIPAKRMRAADKLAMVYIGARDDFVATKRTKERVSNFTTFGWDGVTRTPQPAPAALYVSKGPTGQTIAPVRYFHLANFGHTAGARGFSFNAQPNDVITPTFTTMQGRVDGIVRQHYPVKFKKVMNADIRPVMRRSNKMIRLTY